MLFNKSILNAQLLHREYDFFIPKKKILEVIFNTDEIILTLVKVSKSEITDIHTFLISAMGASGSDENEMYNASIILTDYQLMLQKIDDFQIRWKLNLEIDTYINTDILNVYEMDIDQVKKGYGSEISYMIETRDSFIYFFTNHFYY